MKQIFFLFVLCCSIFCRAQDWSYVGKNIPYSDTLKKSKKFTSIDKALENPETVYHLDIYSQKSGENVKKFSANILKFKNLRKLIVNNQSGSVVELPEEIWSLTKLEYLEIINIQNLKTEGLKNLKNMRYLSLDGFGFSTFPPEIFELNNLEFLNLSCNFLSSIPDEISRLEILKELELTNNCFTKVPPQLRGIKMLSHFVINNAEQGGVLANGKPMCDNSITEFPAVFGEMKNIKRVACFFQTKTNPELKKKITEAYPKIKFS